MRRRGAVICIVLAVVCLSIMVMYEVDSRLTYADIRRMPQEEQLSLNNLPSGKDVHDFLTNRTIIVGSLASNMREEISNSVYYFSSKGRFRIWALNWPVIERGVWTQTTNLLVLYEVDGYHFVLAQKICVLDLDDSLDQSENSCHLVTNLRQAIRGGIYTETIQGDVFSLATAARAPFPLPSKKISLSDLQELRNQQRKTQ